mmetsp:Transcript_35682/g.86100  ORF Transcript_35682/g.86100 Transcript_35682/m.86100 type:complete len:277 (+) Transcript_35682:509-1339(+)
MAAVSPSSMLPRCAGDRTDRLGRGAPRCAPSRAAARDPASPFAFGSGHACPCLPEPSCPAASALTSAALPHPPFPAAAADDAVPCSAVRDAPSRAAADIPDGASPAEEDGARARTADGARRDGTGVRRRRRRGRGNALPRGASDAVRAACPSPAARICRSFPDGRSPWPSSPPRPVVRFHLCPSFLCPPRPLSRPCPYSSPSPPCPTSRPDPPRSPSRSWAWWGPSLRRTSWIWAAWSTTRWMSRAGTSYARPRPSCRRRPPSSSHCCCRRCWTCP